MLAYLELLGAAAAYTAGNLLQAAAAGRSHRVDRLDPGLLRRLADDRMYVAGFLAQVLGFGLAFLARASLPLYLAQAGSNAAVGLTAVAGTLWLGWRLRAPEILALVGMAAGLALLAGSAVPSPATSLSGKAATVLVVTLVAAVGLGAVGARITGTRGAVAMGGCAGVAFGVLAVAGRSAAGGPWLSLPTSAMFWVMVLAAVVGQGLFASSLQRGSTTGAVGTVAAVSTLFAAVSGLTMLSDRIVAGREAWVVMGLVLVLGAVWLLAAGHTTLIVEDVVPCAPPVEVAGDGVGVAGDGATGDGAGVGVEEIAAVGRARTATVIVPAYNEAGTVATSLRVIVEVLRSTMPDRVWEILIVDDGSTDATAAEARGAVAALCGVDMRIRVLRHPVNRGLGGALQTGFRASTGDVVVVIDCDLSYHPGHIPKLVAALENSDADIMIASPYMAGGSTRDVPRGIERRSRLANGFLATASNSGIATLTGMVRAYRGSFIRGLTLKAMDDGINVEAIYKTQVLRGRIGELPATLDWGGLEARAGRSRMRDLRTRVKTYNTLVHGLMFRPYLAFALGTATLIGLGGLLGLVAMVLPGMQLGLTVLGVTLLGTGVLVGFAGVLSVQAKRYFEELYFLLGRERTGEPVVIEDLASDWTGALSLVSDGPFAGLVPPVEVSPRVEAQDGAGTP